MKILLCVDRLTGGGAQRVASLWACGWAERGYDVAIVLSNIRAAQTYNIPEEIPVYDIDWPINNGYIRHFLKFCFSSYRFSRIIKKEKPSVIISVGTYWSKIVYRGRLLSGVKCKIVCTDHNSYERPSNSPMSKRDSYIKFKYNKRFDVVTVLTNADKQFINNRLTNVEVLPNPLTYKISNCIPNKRKIILAVGRLDAGYVKGFDILLNAYSKLDANDWKLRIVGGGRKESLKRYQDLALQLGISSKVEFAGFVDEPLPLYKEAGIFVLSSRFEGFGMVLVEAMSQSCACVACDYKGRQKEIITSDEYGLICKPDDPTELARCLNKLIDNNDYLFKLQENAPLRAAYYSLDRIMERWDAIFNKLSLL